MATKPNLTIISPKPKGHIFICYSHSDGREVEKEILWLEEKGFDVWYDKGIAPGTSWSDELAMAIDECSVFLFFASSRSSASQHCQGEINYALEKQKPLQVVFIEEMVLPPGLELRLGTRQYISKTDVGQAQYEEMLVRALSVHQPQTTGAAASESDLTGEASIPIKRVLVAVTLLVAIVVVGLLTYQSPMFKDDADGIDEGAQSEVDQSKYIEDKQQQSVAVEQARPIAGEQAKSIAVLPLLDLSREGDMEYLADGISEELMNGLFAVPGLHIISRSKAFRYKGSELDVQEIGRQLAVDAVLEGSVRSSGDQLRVSMNLVSVASGFRLWSESYTRTSGNLFEMQDDITAEVVKALSIRLGEKTSRTRMYGTDNIEAYDNYLKGLYLKEGSLEDLESSISFLRRAIALDSSFARPYGELATKLILQYNLFEDQDESLIDEARQLLATADLDTDEDPYVTVKARWHLALRDLDWSGAERVIREAIQSRSGRVLEDHPLIEVLPLERMYGDLLGAAGLFESSTQYYLEARSQYGIDPALMWGLAQNHMALKNYDQAIAASSEALEKWPTAHHHILFLGKIHALSGNWENAEGELDRLIDLGEFESAQNLQILIAIRQGDKELVESILAQEAELGSFPPDLYMMAGKLDEGFQHMNLYLDAGGAGSGWTWILRRFFEGYLDSSIKSDQRYIDVMTKMNLTDEWADILCQRARSLTRQTQITVQCAEAAAR